MSKEVTFYKDGQPKITLVGKKGFVKKWTKILLDELYFSPPESIGTKLEIRLEDMFDEIIQKEKEKS